MTAMYHVTGGVPRLLNTVATTAMLDAWGDDSVQIDEARIARAAEEHRLTLGGKG